MPAGTPLIYTFPWQNGQYIKAEMSESDCEEVELPSETPSDTPCDKGLKMTDDENPERKEKEKTDKMVSDECVVQCVREREGESLSG